MLILLEPRLSISSLVCIPQVLAQIVLNFVHAVYLREFYDSNIKNNLFSCTTLMYWFLQRMHTVLCVRCDLNLCV